MNFKEEVLSTVKRIPKGKVMTYKQVARESKSPYAWRAVGNILNKNKDPRVPCHRVIRSDGKMGGYNKGKKTKRMILEHEK